MTTQSSLDVHLDWINCIEKDYPRAKFCAVILHDLNDYIRKGDIGRAHLFLELLNTELHNLPDGNGMDVDDFLDYCQCKSSQSLMVC